MLTFIRRVISWSILVTGLAGLFFLLHIKATVGVSYVLAVLLMVAGGVCVRCSNFSPRVTSTGGN